MKKINKVSYKKIKKGPKDKFYILMKELFPLLNISTISKKGLVKLSKKGKIFSFLKGNTVSLEYILTILIPIALSIRNWGNSNDDIIEYYQRCAKENLENRVGNDKLDNISQIILFFYNECFHRDTLNCDNSKELKIFLKPHINDNPEEPEEQPLQRGGLAFFIDWVFYPSKKTKKHLRIKKYVIAASISVVLTCGNITTNIQKFTEQLALRAPPMIPTIDIYNST